MEEFFKFLLVAAIIIIGLVRQYKKDAKKNADNSPTMPIPADEIPTPEPWDEDPYGGYIPKGPTPEAATPAPMKTAPQKNTGPIKQSSSSPTSTPISETPTTEESEYGIHTAEEARRAIIWSEILQRKY